MNNPIKSLYRAVIPKKIRALPFVNRIKSALLPHNFIYDSEYYEKSVDPAARQSAAIMARSIVRDTGARRILDVGCGTGAMLGALRELEISGKGLEYSEAALAICSSKGILAKKFDIEYDKLTAEYINAFDVVISTEVAEHLPERVADPYVDTLAAAAPIVVMTAAPPGQGGVDHVNEQPKSYWIEKFRCRGFVERLDLSEKWSTEWQNGGIVTFWYFQNLMVFERKVDLDRRLSDN